MGRIGNALLALAALTAASAGASMPEPVYAWVVGQTVGVPGSVPVRTNVIDVSKSPYNADTNGVTDAGTAIAAAIAAAGSNDVVYLPPGTYLLSEPGYYAETEWYKKHYTLRGAGTNTVVNFTSAWGAAFYIGRGDYVNNGICAITSGYSAGSSNLVLASPVPTNVLLCIWEQVDNSTVFNVNGYQVGSKQLTRVVATNSGNAITIWPPLAWTMQASNSPTCGYAAITGCGVGLEDLVINGTNSTTPGALVGFGNSYGCWMSNVVVQGAPNYAMSAYCSLQCEISHCDWMALGDGPNHSGLICYNIAGCLVEDNIGRKGFPGIEVNDGSVGNVFACNYIHDSHSGTMIGVSIDSNHSPHNRCNLYEGNVCPKFQSDGYFGSDSHETVFRNWFRGVNPGDVNSYQCINLNRFAYHFGVMGNWFGTNLVSGGWQVFNTNGVGEWVGYSYDDHILECYGLPNIGNASYSGYGPPWALCNHDFTGSQTSNTVTSTTAVFTTNTLGSGSWYVTWADNYRYAVTSRVSDYEVTVDAVATKGSQAATLAIGPGGYQELDTNVWATITRLGNRRWDTGEVYPALGTNVLATSLYRSSRPGWWASSLPWPAMGPTESLTNRIPAELRFLGLTISTSTNGPSTNGPSTNGPVAAALEGIGAVSGTGTLTF